MPAWPYEGEFVRVIAGAARRTVLDTPKGLSTRPTADRIKENLFNIIAPYVPCANFLDLFCGSGAIGIEALSRGAAEAVFVDESKYAADVTRANLARVKFESRGKVLCMCAFKAIAQMKQEGRGFDIIFLDPPYGNGLLARALDALGKGSLLSPQGILVAECAIKEPPASSDSFELFDKREYGSTRVEFYAMKSYIQ